MKKTIRLAILIVLVGSLAFAGGHFTPEFSSPSKAQPHRALPDMADLRLSEARATVDMELLFLSLQHEDYAQSCIYLLYEVDPYSCGEILPLSFPQGFSWRINGVARVEDSAVVNADMTVPGGDGKVETYTFFLHYFSDLGLWLTVSLG